MKEVGNTREQAFSALLGSARDPCGTGWGKASFDGGGQWTQLERAQGSTSHLGNPSDFTGCGVLGMQSWGL